MYTLDSIKKENMISKKDKKNKLKKLEKDIGNNSVLGSLILNEHPTEEGYYKIITKNKDIGLMHNCTIIPRQGGLYADNSFNEKD